MNRYVNVKKGDKQVTNGETELKGFSLLPVVLGEELPKALLVFVLFADYKIGKFK